MKELNESLILVFLKKEYLAISANSSSCWTFRNFESSLKYTSSKFSTAKVTACLLSAKYWIGKKKNLVSEL